MAWAQADRRMLQNACRRIRCGARECQPTILIVFVLWAHLPELRLPRIIGFTCVDHQKNKTTLVVLFGMHEFATHLVPEFICRC